MTLIVLDREQSLQFFFKVSGVWNRDYETETECLACFLLPAASLLPHDCLCSLVVSVVGKIHSQVKPVYFNLLRLACTTDETQRLQNSAKILVLGLHLCTRIWMPAVIDSLKSHSQFASHVEGKFEMHLWYSRTSTNGHLSTMATFYGGQSMHWL